MKKTWAQTIGITAAAAVITVTVCGCSVVKRLHTDLESAYEAIDQNEGIVEYQAIEGATTNFAMPIEDTAIDVAGPSEAAVSEAIASADTHESDVDKALRKEYAEHGLTYSEVNGQWWFEDKPVAVLRDRTHFTMTNGTYLEIGALVLIERDNSDKITGISTVSQERIQAETGMTFSNTPNEQTAKEEGYRFYKEDVNVQDMTAKELYDLENELHVKYIDQKAMVQCNDYIIYLEEDDILSLSSFCCTDHNTYGVKVCADYAVADEIDLKEFDSIEIDYLLMNMLKDNTYENAQQVEQAAKEAVAEKYGISTKNLAAIASLM